MSSATKETTRSKTKLSPLNVLGVSVFGCLKRNQTLLMELGLAGKARQLNDIMHRAIEGSADALADLAENGETDLRELHDRVRLALEEEATAAAEFPEPVDDQEKRQQKITVALRDCADMLDRYEDAFSGSVINPEADVKVSIDRDEREVVNDTDAAVLVAQALSKVLADTYALYIKSLNYHWNVTGPKFRSLHALFEEHYQDLHRSGDEIAERIRALGFFAPGSLREFDKLSTIQGDSNVPESADLMINNLIEAHGVCRDEARELITLAAKAGDEVTADLMIGRVNFHEQTIWMLNASL